jgi:GDP-L-fucose synthase
MNNFMAADARIYIAGHRGLAGSALVRQLQGQGYSNLILRTHAELDLLDQTAVRAFFAKEKPEYVFLAAAKVGGIHANNTYPADFISQNLRIQSNVIEASFEQKVERLLFLGSSCIYPRMAPQPMKEEHLLTGLLEATNRPYALAKIAGIEMCWAFNRQHGTRYLAAMPTNLYGIGDNYHPENSHVLPALIRRVHEAKQRDDQQIVLWGTGSPLREFLYSDDMAAGCIHLLNLPGAIFDPLVDSDEVAPLVNLGSNEEISIRALLEQVCRVLHYKGQIVLDPTKPDGTPRKRMDSSRLRSLGWAPKVGMEEGIERAYEDFKGRGIA